MYRSSRNIFAGKCEQAESTQGNPVLEILPSIGELLESIDSFFFGKRHNKKEKKRASIIKKDPPPTHAVMSEIFSIGTLKENSIPHQGNDPPPKAYTLNDCCWPIHCPLQMNYSTICHLVP